MLSEVNWNLLILFLGGLESCTEVGRGEICYCSCVLISNIIWVADGCTILPNQIVFRWVDNWPDILLTVPHVLDWGVGVDSWGIFCPWFSFFWLNNCRACAWVCLNDMSVCAPFPLRIFLSRTYPNTLHRTKDYTFWGLWSPYGCYLLQQWWCVKQRRRGVLILKDFAWDFVHTWLCKFLLISLWEYPLTGITSLVSVHLRAGTGVQMERSVADAGFPESLSMQRFSFLWTSQWRHFWCHCWEYPMGSCGN